MRPVVGQPITFFIHHQFQPKSTTTQIFSNFMIKVNVLDESCSPEQSRSLFPIRLAELDERGAKPRLPLPFGTAALSLNGDGNPALFGHSLRPTCPQIHLHLLVFQHLLRAAHRNFKAQYCTARTSLDIDTFIHSHNGHQVAEIPIPWA